MLCVLHAWCPFIRLTLLQYFTHERGTYIALYGLTLAGSSFLAPVFAGFINDGQGWPWVLVILLTNFSVSRS